MSCGKVHIQALDHDNWVDVIALPNATDTEMAAGMHDAQCMHRSARFRAVNWRGGLIDTI